MLMIVYSDIPSVWALVPVCLLCVVPWCDVCASRSSARRKSQGLCSTAGTATGTPAVPGQHFHGADL